MSRPQVAVVGGGLAGCEAAAMVARLGYPVDLFEMKPKKFSPAHKSDRLSELVCSNSLGALDPHSAPGLLKTEMRALGSVVLRAAEGAAVPAGKALAVDRDRFSDRITEMLENEPRVTLRREECVTVPDYPVVIIATGPLTSDALASDLANYVGRDTLYFYDSISPVVAADSIDYEKVYFASRYQEGSDDYLNCPLDRDQYERLVREILEAEKVPIRAFEAMNCFEACLPIEVLAARGEKTLAFGPMKPVGLPDPRTGKIPCAVVQLRRENDPTTLYNVVGFQTRMRWGEQQRIFRMIPGLEKAEFVRYGAMHRNTYLESPRLLHSDLGLKSHPHILIAGQLTGVEGYVESAAMGQWAGLTAASRLRGAKISHPPRESAFGGLLHMITTPPSHGAFAPMNMNFGLLPPLEGRVRGRPERRKQMVQRAEAATAAWRREIEDSLGAGGIDSLKLPNGPHPFTEASVTD